MVGREAPQSFWVNSLFAVRKLLGFATFALIVVLLAPKLFLFFDNPKNAAVSAFLLEGRD